MKGRIGVTTFFPDLVNFKVEGPAEEADVDLETVEQNWRVNIIDLDIGDSTFVLPDRIPVCDERCDE